MSAQILEFKIPEKDPWFHPDRLTDAHEHPYHACHRIWWYAHSLRDALTEIRISDRLIDSYQELDEARQEQIDCLQEQVRLLREMNDVMST